MHIVIIILTTLEQFTFPWALDYDDRARVCILIALVSETSRFHMVSQNTTNTRDTTLVYKSITYLQGFGHKSL